LLSSKEKQGKNMSRDLLDDDGKYIKRSLPRPHLDEFEAGEEDDVVLGESAMSDVESEVGASVMPTSRREWAPSPITLPPNMAQGDDEVAATAASASSRSRRASWEADSSTESDDTFDAEHELTPRTQPSSPVADSALSKMPRSSSSGSVASLASTSTVD
jgi:hypothetical protein